MRLQQLDSELKRRGINMTFREKQSILSQPGPVNEVLERHVNPPQASQLPELQKGGFTDPTPASTTRVAIPPMPSQEMIKQDVRRQDKERRVQEFLFRYPNAGYSGAMPSQGTIRSAPTTFERAIRKADVATDVMQLGNFVPHPIGQAIGKTGSVLGSAIDLYQAYDSAKEGNYLDAAINAGSAGLASALSLNTFKRNSKYLIPGQTLYPLSPQAKNLPGGYTRTTYIEPFENVRGMTNKSLLANRALLGAIGTETVYDAVSEPSAPKYQTGGQYDPTPQSSTRVAMPPMLPLGQMVRDDARVRNIAEANRLIQELPDEFKYKGPVPAQGKIDYPSTDRRSGSFSGTPNMQFAAPNMKGQMRAQAEQYHGDIIGGELIGLGISAGVSKGVSAVESLQRKTAGLVSEYRTPTMQGYMEANPVHNLKSKNRIDKEGMQLSEALAVKEKEAVRAYDQATQDAWPTLFKYNQHIRYIGRHADKVEGEIASKISPDAMRISSDNISPQYAYWLENKGLLDEALRNKKKYLNDPKMVDEFLENYTRSQRGVVLPKTAAEQEVIDALKTTRAQHGKMLGDGNYSSNSPQIRDRFATATSEDGQGWYGQLKLNFPFERRTPKERVDLLRGLIEDEAEVSGINLPKTRTNRPIIEGSYGGGSQRKLDRDYFEKFPEFFELESLEKATTSADPLTHSKKGYFGLKDAATDPSLFSRPAHAEQILRNVKRYDTGIKRSVQSSKQSLKDQIDKLEMLKSRKDRVKNVTDDLEKKLTKKERDALNALTNDRRALNEGRSKLENRARNTKSIATGIGIVGTVVGAPVGLFTSIDGPSKKDRKPSQRKDSKKNQIAETIINKED